MHVSRALGGVTILQKGAQDIICTNTGGSSEADARVSKVDASENTEEQVAVDVPGGLKRCGGQGDILSGTVGTALAWGKCFEDGAYGYVCHLDHLSILILLAPALTSVPATTLSHPHESPYSPQ